MFRAVYAYNPLPLSAVKYVQGLCNYQHDEAARVNCVEDVGNLIKSIQEISDILISIKEHHFEGPTFNTNARALSLFHARLKHPYIKAPSQVRKEKHELHEMGTRILFREEPGLYSKPEIKKKTLVSLHD